jgi:AbrB family looped-hinge helix DNA binding protein
MTSPKPDNRVTGRTSITSKGQITLPVAVRNRVGLHTGDRLQVDVDGREVRLKPVQSDVDDLYGSFAIDEPSLTAKQLRNLAEDLIVEDALRRNGGR